MPLCHLLSLAATVSSLLLPFHLKAQELAEGWDFIPGEKLLLYDDFTDMAKGAAPPHWKVRGASVRLGSDGRLVLRQETQLYPNVPAWPRNYTIELDFTIQKTENSDLTWTFANADGEEQWKLWIRFTDESKTFDANLEGEGTELGGVTAKYEPGQLNTLNLWTQEGRIRVYFNKDRLIDVNQVKSQPIGQVWLSLSPNEETVVTIARCRIAESTPDITKTILSTGRFVTHGITFDVNSDRLRPESMPVLKMVADAMTAQPALKLRIEGHTDSSGDAVKNLDLSRRRAQSVKEALVSHFKIDAARLSTEGFGSSKPLSPNDTPQGRANNRRVEFAKL